MKINQKIECSNSAYEKLQALGIEKRTNKVKEDLRQIFLYKTIWDGKAKKILKEIKRNKKQEFELEEEEKDILSLEAKLEAEDFVAQIDNFVIEHPYLVAKVVLGEDLNNFVQYGFSSKLNLASAINAYCIGERDIINNNKSTYIWRSGEYKNKVNLMDHGDLHVSQTEVLGIEESGVLIDPKKSGFGLQQDWSVFLISVLKYAQALGKTDIPEIKNWQELLKEVRKSNPWGAEYSTDLTEKEFHLTLLFESDLLGARNENLKLRINNRVLPYFSAGKLEIIEQNEKGNLEITVYRQPERFFRIAAYIPEDIPHLLKANYQLYARSVNDLAKIMYWFNEKHSV